jgi:GR25 family glycosyltransferase involved in LPS biosynthesis
MKCFVINLDRRQDRLERFTKTFGKYFEIIKESAVDNKELKITQSLKARINEWNFKYIPHKVKNITACCLSHINVWKKISKMNEPYVFVFEDDCTFINEMVETNFNTYFSSLVFPKDFGIIWMQGNIQDKPGTPTQLPFTIKNFTDDNTAESYIITPSFAKELVYEIENNLGAVDRHMSDYTRKVNNVSFKVFPPFFCQFDRRDTDIQI